MRFFPRFCWICGLALLFWLPVKGQLGYVQGKVMDSTGRKIIGVRVLVEGLDDSTFTNEKGFYKLSLPVGKYYLLYKKLGYKTARERAVIRPGGTENINVKMQEGAFELGTTVITRNVDPKEIEDPDQGFVRLIPIDVSKVSEMTSIKGDLTSKLQTMGAGVSTSNEFSSQYRVRGGNFDENLVYVNDIEIYRPFLVRSGQQEGLGFVNPNLARGVGFSSGGFKPKYGDKLSSVLDVQYKTPEEFHGSAELGILNLNAHVEGVIQRSKKIPEGEKQDYLPGVFTYLIGGRRFTPQYVLNSLDTQGEYRPVFHDAQGMFTFRPRRKGSHFRIRERYKARLDSTIFDTSYVPRDPLKFTAFLHFADNNYRFVPEGRETSFGTIQNVLRLRVAFVGQEVTDYTTGTAAFVVEHRPTVKTRFKYIFSAFQTVESELFDVEGGYFLSDVNTNFGSEGYNEVVFDRGIGTFYQRGRNYLTATVLSAAQRGDWFPGKNFRHKISWGMRYQRQLIDDQLDEWRGVDSSGYFQLQESFRSEATLNSNLYKAYIQDHWKVSKNNTHRLIFGTRAVYNDLNDQFFMSPRIQYVIDPAPKKDPEQELEDGAYAFGNKRRYQLRFAAGVYHQPLFYREMRDFDGSLNLDRPAQTAYHFIAGGDYLFKIWGRPFKVYTEAYYKILENLIPYEVENVRIRYYPFETANGYAYGIDTRITGEFLKGVDSWMSMGFLKTQERVEGLDQGYVSRPTDQRFTFSMYFQDELPINPTYKVHINFFYGSGLRFGFPRKLEARTALTVPSYQRVDLGFSKLILFRAKDELEDKKFPLQSLWLSAEIFNLFQRANTVSHIWIKDVFNNQFAVPNFLSQRLLNIRLIMRF